MPVSILSFLSLEQLLISFLLQPTLEPSSTIQSSIYIYHHISKSFSRHYRMPLHGPGPLLPYSFFSALLWDLFLLASIRFLL